jgi:hypothetical protein
MDARLLVMLNALHLAQQAVETALGGQTKGRPRSDADLRLLEAAMRVLKEDANAVVALLIARLGDDEMIAEAEALFCYFEQVEAQIAATIEVKHGLESFPASGITPA